MPDVGTRIVAGVRELCFCPAFAEREGRATEPSQAASPRPSTTPGMARSKSRLANSSGAWSILPRSQTGPVKVWSAQRRPPAAIAMPVHGAASRSGAHVGAAPCAHPYCRLTQCGSSFGICRSKSTTYESNVCVARARRSACPRSIAESVIGGRCCARSSPAYAMGASFAGR